MAKPRDFTDIERAAMEAVRFFARQLGGAEAFADRFDLNRRTAYRLVGMQQPPPVGIAQKLANYAMEEWSASLTPKVHDPAPDHIVALRAFIAQRTTPKGGARG